MKIAEKFIQKVKEIDEDYGWWKHIRDNSERIKVKRTHDKLITENYLNFKIALFKEYGVIDNPKAERCFSLAWEHGHSNGYNEVEIYFSEFVELIK